MRDAIDLKMEQKGFIVKTLYKMACKKQTAKVMMAMQHSDYSFPHFPLKSQLALVRNMGPSVQ
jgi:hypothetical protein